MTPVVCDVTECLMFTTRPYRTQDEPDSVVNTTTTESTVLDVDPYTVKFYIGGVPDDAGISEVLVNSRFQGCVEEVTFNGSPVGLWDFVQGENNGNGCIMR